MSRILFQTATKPGDLTFGRFFLLNENPPKPHFSPSLKEAIAWFTGQSQPKDGYGTIFWGEQVVYECSVYKVGRKMPLRITKVERLMVARSIPTPLDIAGSAGGGGGVGVDGQRNTHPEIGRP